MNIEKTLQNNTITIARAFLALGMLITLLFTPLEDLFPIHHFLELKENVSGLMKLNYFLWFDNIQIPYFISIVVFIFVISGYYPRYIAIFHSWATYSLFYSMLVVEGGDQINTILTFLLIPICILDGRKNAWIINKEVTIKKNILYYNAKYSLLFISVQMAILYFNAGTAKMFAPEWSNGTAIYYWFNDNMFGAPNWLESITGFLFTNDITVTIISWSVIILELFLFVGLFLKQKYKYLLFVLGVVFHFFIILVHGLPTFFIAMTAGLILLYFQKDISVKENLKLIKLTLIQLKNELLSRENQPT